VIIVADASPLLALASCECLDVLERLFGTVRVSQAVYAEVTLNGKPYADRLAIYLQHKVVALDVGVYIISGANLDTGELTALALYKQLHADYLLIDEKAGRRVAKLNQVRVVGSLGVLVAAKQKGHISSLKPHIDSLRQAKIYFSEALLNCALQQVGE
jgi:predicted nucleic acid-binding protein